MRNVSKFELPIQNDPEALAWYGSAVLWCNNLAWLLGRVGGLLIKDSEIKKEIDKNNELGRLIGLIEKHNVLDKNLIERLWEFNGKRKLLAHAVPEQGIYLDGEKRVVGLGGVTLVNTERSERKVQKLEKEYFDGVKDDAKKLGKELYDALPIPKSS